MDVRTERPTADELLALYEKVGWTAYTSRPADVATALAASTWTATVRHEGQLVGFARALSDEAVFAWLQDVLVDPAFQGRGLGRRLVEAWRGRFAHCRQRLLLTDDRPEQRAFYERVGLVDTGALGLVAFVDRGQG